MSGPIVFDLDGGLVDSTPVIAAYRDRCRATAGVQARVFTGIPALLDRLVADGRTLAVVTSKPRSIATWLVSAVGLDRWSLAVHVPGEVDGEVKAVTRGPLER